MPERLFRHFFCSIRKPLMINTLPWILTAVLYAPVLFSLYHHAWEELDYTHAYFVLPLSLFIAWLKRRQLKELSARATPSPDKNAVIFLAFGIFLFIFGWRQNYLSLQTLSLIPVVYGMLRRLYPPEIARELRFPVFYLLLLVPPPLGILDQITLPMRYETSIASEWILRAMHYPVAREGLLLTVGGHEIFLGAPCSGLRSLITMSALGLAYVYFNRNDFRKNLILLVSIVPLALLGNLIRVLVLCLITFYFGEKVGQGFFHDFSGLMVFLVMIFGLMLIEKILDKNSNFAGLRPSPEPASPAPQVLPEKFNPSRAYWVIALLLVAILIAFGLPKPKYQSAKILHEITLPKNLLNWTSLDVSNKLDSRDDRYKFMSDIFARIYGNSDGKSLLFIVLDAGNFHHPRVCFGSSGFNLTELPDIPLSPFADFTFNAKTLWARKGEQNVLIVYWMCIDRKQVNWAEQKINQFWTSLTNQRKTGLMMRMDVPVEGNDTAAAVGLAQEFVRDFGKFVTPQESEYVFGK